MGLMVLRWNVNDRGVYDGDVVVESIDIRGADNSQLSRLRLYGEKTWLYVF